MGHFHALITGQEEMWDIFYPHKRTRMEMWDIFYPHKKTGMEIWDISMPS